MEQCLKNGESQTGDYGRIPLQQANRSIFTPTPWGSPTWQRGYHRRGRGGKTLQCKCLEKFDI